MKNANVGLISGLFLWLSIPVSAQNLLGISTSRFGGTNQLYLNPALAADSPYTLYVNGITANAHLDNNYVRYQAPFSLLRLLTGRVQPQYRNSDGSVSFDQSYTREMAGSGLKNGTLWGEVRGPALLFRKNERSAFAVTTRFRAMGQVLGASRDLLSAIRASLNDNALYSIPSTNNQFSANINTYSELGFTYAATLWNYDGRKLLLGVTGKLLLGYNTQHFINEGLDYQVKADPYFPARPVLEVTSLEGSLGYTSFLNRRTFSPRLLLSPNAPGKGAGLDVGLTYVNRFDNDSPAWRLGLALTDLGGLRYKADEYLYKGTDVQQTPVTFSGSDFNSIGNTEQLARIVQNKLSANRNPDRTSFRVGLPTSLNLTADYDNPNGLGINLTYLQDVRPLTAVAVHQPTLIAVTPRFSKRYVGLAMPVSYLNGGLMVGGSVRIGPGWLGTDNFLGLVGNSRLGIRPRGLDIYAGVALGFGRQTGRE